MSATLRLLGFSAALVLVAVMVGVAVFVLATYAHLYAHTRDGRRIARALPREFLAELLAVLSWPGFALFGRGYRGLRRGARPVILLHGYGMNRMSFFGLGRMLARRGVGPLHAMTYLTVRSVRHSAQRLARYVDHVCAEEGAAEVDLVCHSLGGIVASYYAFRLGGSARVRQLVTIGTPHQGTLSARAGIDRAACDLRPRSSVLEDLADCERPDSVCLTSIWSRADNIIVPPENAALGETDIVFEHLGHMALLLSPRVADRVAALLAAHPASDAPEPSELASVTP